jgi:hypothetical protein
MAHMIHGRSEVEDDECLGYPLTLRNQGNLENISEIVQKDRHLSIVMIAEMVNMDKEMVRQILQD